VESEDHTSGPASLQPPLGTPRAILLFDGVCNLCNGFVNFVLDHDSEGEILMGALQSEAARPYLQAFDMDPEALGTVVLIENGQPYTRSTAALRVLRRLDAPWPLLYAFIAVPRPLRDWVYDRIAANRYQWFGKRDQCRMPTPELKARFLEDPV
jgi:predicted DCC family thiol-disulfide oxidoreductase YuxK